MKVDAWNIDVGTPATSADAFGLQLLHHVVSSWDQGADLVLMPEYCWLGAEPHLGGGLDTVAAWFWEHFWPIHRHELIRPEKAAVLGTVPCRQPDGSLRNRAPIVADGQEWHQDKLALTPWENAMLPGTELRIWSFAGQKVAVLVCLDIEVPEWSALLRGQGLDLLLVPSATETLMGVERISRCASARAVELGCAVITAHLVGKSQSTLVDENVGRAAMYLPSQAATSQVARVTETAVRSDGSFCTSFWVDTDHVRLCKLNHQETNPALLGAMGGPVTLCGNL
jgi:predicted amidohydrolase